MTTKELRANILLLITAAIWGFAFVAQRVGVENIGTFSFNGIRFLLGSISLLPLIFILKCKSKAGVKYVIKSGVIAGLFLYCGASLQTYGLAFTTAGKGAFVTSLYMVIIPIIGIFLKQRTSLYTWIGVILSLLGLSMLCIEDKFSVNFGDFLVFLGSFFWAGHVLFIDYFNRNVHPLILSSIQFAVCGILSIISAILINEPLTFISIQNSIIPLLYGGLMSVGVAYTLQVVAQVHAKPSHAAIILSLESCFGALGGVIILNETMQPKGYIGCVIIFAAILISQIRTKKSDSIS